MGHRIETGGKHMREWDIGMRLHAILNRWTNITMTAAIIAAGAYVVEKLT